MTEKNKQKKIKKHTQVKKKLTGNVFAKSR